jgi:hypothetical protein
VKKHRAKQGIHATEMAAEPLVVQAIFPFKGANNDELCFKKGDIITVTQKDDGWWEGTLNGKTGWFPSNYVKESKDAPKPVIVQQNQYKSVVLKDLIDSEKAHVTELDGLVTNFLQPLEKSSTLTPDEYKQLTGNIAEVLETHQQLLKLMEIEQGKPGLEQRIGRLFINWAPRIKSVNQAYCALHPKAACILDQYKYYFSDFNFSFFIADYFHQRGIDKVYGGSRGHQSRSPGFDRPPEQTVPPLGEILGHASGVGASRGGVPPRQGRHSAFGRRLQRHRHLLFCHQTPERTGTAGVDGTGAGVGGSQFGHPRRHNLHGVGGGGPATPRQILRTLPHHAFDLVGQPPPQRLHLRGESSW